MSRKNNSAIIFAICYVLFSLGLNGSDLGLPQYITFNRIAYILIGFTGFFSIVKNPNKKITITKQNIFLIVIICFIILWSILSIFASPYYSEVSITSLFYWILLLYIALVIMTLISNIDYSWTRKFYDSLVIINAIINIYTIVWVFRTVGINNISNIYLIRSTMDTLSVGLNRFLSGLFFISFISIPVSLGIIKNKRLYVISVINFVSLVLLIIFSGSRQNLIAVLSYTVLCIINCNLLYKSKYDKKRKINSKIGLLVTIFVFVLPFLYFSHKGISLIQFIKFRFIDVVAKKQSELGVIDPRILIIRQAAVGIKERPIFGHGIGTFMELNGIYSHNGYLNFAFEIGIIPFLIVLCYFLFSAIKGLISKRIILNNSMDELYIVSSSLFIVIAFVSNIFNDFLSSNTLWIAFILFNRSIKNIGFKESTDK